MLRTLLRIIKGEGFIAGLLLFLGVGFVFPSLHSGHEHGAQVAFEQHNYVESAGQGWLSAHDHSNAFKHGHGDHDSPPAQCNDDCCAPGCYALSAVADVNSLPCYFEAGRVVILEDHYLSGLVLIPPKRPPRA